MRPSSRRSAKDPELRPRDVEAWVASFADALEAMPSDAARLDATDQKARSG